MLSPIEILTPTCAGYGSLLHFDGWRVAAIRDDQSLRRPHLNAIAKHMETDEVFILIEGEATLYYAAPSETPGAVLRLPMPRGQAVNVKAGTWHVVETGAGALIYVVENDDTGADNTVRCPIADDRLPRAIAP